MILEFIQSYPRTSIIAIALLISFFISLVNYFVMDKEKMCEIKLRQKEMQDKIKHHQSKGEHEQAMKVQTEMLSTMGETFKHSLKPMLITTIPIIVVFGLIKNAYVATPIAGTWFWWYLGSAIAASLAFRKLFKLP
jgi:uncharacterized membrane protein (DUF106 family)